MNTLQKISVSAFVAIFFLIALFGVHISMAQDGHSMTHCPFMDDSSSICPMNITEHVQSWHNAFLIIPLFKIMIGWGCAVLFLFFLKKYSSFLARCGPLLRPLLRQRAEEKIHSFLVLAFSQGILQKKIYPEFSF